MLPILVISQVDEYKGYHENGQLLVEGDLKDGKEEGLWKFYNENGQLDEEVYFKDGLLTSKTCWDENGEKRDCWFSAYDTYCDGDETFELREPENMDYGNDDGRLELFCVYRKLFSNMTFSGMVYDVYPNGELKYKMKYEKGKLKGMVTFYNDDGSFYCQIKYKNNFGRNVTKVFY